MSENSRTPPRIVNIAFDKLESHIRPMLTTKRIKELAHEIGFDLCGVCSAEPIEEARQAFLGWLSNGYQAEMAYLAKEPERRVDPSKVLPGARSAIMLALNYYSADYHSELPPDQGRVSRYARGRDYHKVMERKLGALAALIESECDDPPRLKRLVDYGPFLERAYAARAGLGYLGKNGLLITRQFGSWVVLAEIITDLELEPDDPKTVNHGRCGQCRLCIDACPTGAIVAEGVVDSSRCISYLTIERPSRIPTQLGPSLSPWLFGCDVCQDVCPHNGGAVPTTHAELLPESGVGESLSLPAVLKIETREQFLKITAGTPLTRPKLEGLQRTAEILQAHRFSDEK